MQVLIVIVQSLKRNWLKSDMIEAVCSHVYTGHNYYSWLIIPLLQERCWYIFKVKLYLLQLGRVLGILALNLQMRGHSAN